MFENGPPKIFEKRWGILTDVLTVARPQFLVARTCWDAQLYGSKSDGPDDTFAIYQDEKVKVDVQLLMDTLRSNFLFAFTDTIIALHSTVDNCSAWSEGCYCHECNVGTDKSRVSAYSQTADFDAFEACAVKSLQAPEMAAGEIVNVYDANTHDAKSDLAIAVLPYLSIDEEAVITEVYEHGVF